MASLSLWQPKSHYRQTRKGKILQSTTELYLRDDLGLGYTIPSHSSAKRNNVSVTITGSATKISNAQNLLELLIPTYSKTDKTEKTRLVVVDTNVLLHNLDVLEHSSCAISNIVIPQTALLECRHRSFTAYNRVMDLLKSSTSKDDSSDKKRCAIFFPDCHHISTQIMAKKKMTVNEENDMRIRQVALYYGDKLAGSGVDVILLTDDKDCRKLALKEQKDALDDESLLYQPMSVREHILDLENEDHEISLSDLVAQFSTVVSTEQTKKQYYPAHLPQNELSIGVKSGKFFQGYIRAERGCHDKCYVTVRQGEDRVAVNIIGAKDINRAVDGDIVAIELNPVSKWIGSDNDVSVQKKVKHGAGIAEETAEPSIRDESNVMDEVEVPAEMKQDPEEISMRKPTGRVMGIIRRNFRTNYCGSIFTIDKSMLEEKQDDDISERDRIVNEYEVEHPDGSTTCVFFAVDARIPPVLIRTTQRERLLSKRILIAIDSWPSDSPYPLGHYVKTMGVTGVKDVETEVLLHEHNIPCDPFPAKVLACLPPEDYKIELEPGRIDLRHLPVLSIDPPGCQDIDDALHCIVLPNGNYQVGVHIADVTHYVKAGTAIDLEAANRSTSTYLVNKRLDMLPKLLTTDLCSLKGNVDRFAFSVLWEVTPEADIVDVQFKKSIIHSIAALTYQQAQGMIDQPDDETDIKASAVKRLNSLARILRKRRIDTGALTLASPEVKFVLDSESLNPTDVQAYTLYEANALVEEFMLFANVTVGKKILRHYPTLSVLRRHPAPNRSMFDSLISKAKCKGFSINIEDSKHLADSLDAAVLEEDPYFNKLLRILSTRCMSPAQYFCSGEYKPTDWHHYGLAAPVYTHFTSPIRRYADVCVHRLLAAAIGVEPLPVHLSSKSYLHDLAANMNRRHRSAQLAGRASVQLHTLIVFSGENGNKEEDAYVLDVDTNASSEPSFTVIVPRYGIEGRVRIPNITANDKNIVRDAEKHLISYKGKKIQVFDKVRVKIYVNVVQETQKELMIDLVSPVFGEQVDKTSCGEIEATLEKKRKASTKSSSGPTSAKKRKKNKSKK
ncbi:exosome complex exonuclease DIS3/RRP44 [Chaetoceros tenuissimus]|uniref:Ribosomal RNA-processing protein 44 n=1 Tax=Chaetoceros tenuissimus TaxID=426638 RepID=A0AAD3D062_9STRA|nr:exosome complex exonuclease DIS3/RRP44 [Chaetoceros tenuissimus]